MGRNLVFLGFRHVFGGRQSRGLQMIHCRLQALQLGCKSFCLWIPDSSASGKLQIMLYKFNLQASHIHSPSFISPKAGQNRGEELETGFLNSCFQTVWFLPRLAMGGQNREEKLKPVFVLNTGLHLVLWEMPLKVFFSMGGKNYP